MSTPYHAKYFAYELTKQAAGDDADRLSRSLFDACVDLNPHQIDAALFAFRSPLSLGVLFADEVGLGKTIEAGLVLCQYWAERKRRLLVICPASLRKQWSIELEEKFNLPTTIIDARSYHNAIREGIANPFEQELVVIISMNYAARMQREIRLINWDLAVIDEAHKLRNAYRESNRMGQAIRWALEERRKLLLTATPLQNSLLELYGLSTLIDDKIFGDLPSFRAQYTGKDSDLDELKNRLRSFCQRTLRSQVLEYVQYTERRPLTCPFTPTDIEQKLYDAISDFLRREGTYAIPHRQRELTTLILRKLLASSTLAVAGTLETIKARLEKIRAGLPVEIDIVEQILGEEDIETDLLEESQAEEVEEEEGIPDEIPNVIDRAQLEGEIAELDRYITIAHGIQVDTKTRALLKALEIGFNEMAKNGAARKAIIFTESRRTQEYLRNFLEANGYANKLVLFSGTNSGSEAKRIYDRWVEINKPLGRTSGSRIADQRLALVEYFRDEAEIMIATESAAEGINLQFCSQVVNYDLPWNPQRIEQRIGRCHRYGQKHDVVVINFLNGRNEADRRVLELLNEKFNLFSGVFGASDEILGTIESGVDFEKRVLAIYQQCRTSEEIAAAFAQLQQEMEELINSRLAETRRLLLEHFDEDVHARLRMKLDETRQNLDLISMMFWSLSKLMLDAYASFDDIDLTFDLQKSPCALAQPGRYHLISKYRENVTGEYLYRLSHPLGEYVTSLGKALPTPAAEVRFNITDHPVKITLVERLCGMSGALTLTRLVIDSFATEEYLLFSGVTDDGVSIDEETCEKLFHCQGTVQPAFMTSVVTERLKQASARRVSATISRSLEVNNHHFQQERERLEKWADDLVLAAEKELIDTKIQIRALNRQARQSATTEEQHALQTRIRDLEKRQRRQRQRIFDVEDEINEKRDELIDRLEKRMAQRTTTEMLFTIRWAVV